MQSKTTIKLSLALFLALCLGSYPDRARSEVTFEPSEFRDRAILTAVPDEPRALVFVFHGTGGSSRFIDRPQTRAVVDRLYRAGYALVSADSKDRGPRNKWKIKDAGAKSNIDIRDMLALREHLVETTGIEAATPVFTMGMSNGGAFCSLFGYVASANGVPVAAIANYMGPIPAAARALFDSGVPFPPLFIVAAENDGLVSLQTIRKGVGILEKGGTKIELHVVKEQPLTRNNLLDTGLIEESNADRLMDFLHRGGYIDPNGSRLYKADAPLTRTDLEALLKPALEAGFQRGDLNAVLVVWGAHQMRSDFAEQQFSFFERHMGVSGR